MSETIEKTSVEEVIHHKNLPPLPPNTDPFYTFKTVLSAKNYQHFLIVASFFRYYRVPIMLYGISLLVTFALGMGHQILFWPFYLLISLVIFVLMVLVFLLKIQMRKKKAVKEDLSGRFSSEMTLHFCSDKLVFVTPSHQAVSEIPYEQIYQVVESRKLYMIYLTSNQAVLLPKAVINPEQAQAFNQFIRAHITRKYKDISKFI